jgi:hypothetical protein
MILIMFIIGIICYLGGIFTVVVPAIVRADRESKIESGFERHRRPQNPKRRI